MPGRNWEAARMRTIPFSGIRKIFQAAAELERQGQRVIPREHPGSSGQDWQGFAQAAGGPGCLGGTACQVTMASPQASFRRRADQSSSTEIMATASRPMDLAYAAILSRLMSVFTLELPLW